ncbi:hypothetical protein [Methanotorris igneus]|uniref:Uncharacterized protein n=1 Tax=Methanotorris igneus (strain DSM 5666 / JCM 11834 / Kol 5) TaxID=880724 RepID=F6BDV2_METIK|nr:hypothetical protein [Methanotorris igneus]AEF96663.1 hypothetical protein Metig_1124 [Methanotorris igneus Kol 5]
MKLCSKGILKSFAALVILGMVGVVFATPVAISESNKDITVQKVNIKVVKNTPTDQIVKVNGNLIKYHTNGKVNILETKNKNIKSEYLIKVTKIKENKYRVDVYKDGKLIKSEITNNNPIKVNLVDIPIPRPHAYIDIHSDKYNYNVGEFGKVTIDVKNSLNGLILGHTIYYLRIPDGVRYYYIVDGPQPDAVRTLKEGDYIFVPYLGIVKGPCTLLIWQSLDYSDYKKRIVVKVKYLNKGVFIFKSGDAIKGAFWGIGDQDYDSFTVYAS